MRCHEYITEDDQKEMYNKFVSFASKNEQDAHLQNLIEIKPVARRRPRLTENDRNEGKTSKPKELTYVYWLNSSSGRKQVCKNAFLSTYGVSDDRVKRLKKLLALGESPQDKRGKSTSGNAKSVRLALLIQDHIKKYPVYTTHYSSNEYTYLSPRLNVKIMWQAFLQLHPELIPRKGESSESVTYWFYMKIFQESFDLKFGQPQIDTCCVCEELNVKIRRPHLNNNAKRVAVAELMLHKRRAKKFYSKLREVEELAKTHDDVAGLTFDFMQNIMLPATPVQETFYLRQLTVNVFNIHCLKTNTARFYLYHEGTAKKGPNEVCSFLLDYIEEKVSNNVKHLYIMSDGCGGQNKNHCLVRFFLMLVDVGRFETITHCFPIRGHSYLPCDRDFSMVKRKIKKTDRIYTPKEYTELIVQSSVQNKFEVKMIETSDIKNIHDWWPQYYKKVVVSVETKGANVPSDTKIKFKVSQYNQFVFMKNMKGIVTAKPFIDGLVASTFNVSKGVSPAYPTSRAYNGHMSISHEKMEDIKKFLPYLPEEPEVREFYAQIFGLPTHRGT